MDAPLVKRVSARICFRKCLGSAWGAWRGLWHLCWDMLGCALGFALVDVLRAFRCVALISSNSGSSSQHSQLSRLKRSPPRLKEMVCGDWSMRQLSPALLYHERNVKPPDTAVRSSLSLPQGGLVCKSPAKQSPSSLHCPPSRRREASQATYLASKQATWTSATTHCWGGPFGPEPEPAS